MGQALSGLNDQIGIQLSDQTHTFISRRMHCQCLGWRSITSLPINPSLYLCEHLTDGCCLRNAEQRMTVIRTRDAIHSRELVLRNRETPIDWHKRTCCIFKEEVTSCLCVKFHVWGSAAMSIGREIHAESGSIFLAGRSLHYSPVLPKVQIRHCLYQIFWYKWEIFQPLILTEIQEPS